VRPERWGDLAVAGLLAGLSAIPALVESPDPGPLLVTVVIAVALIQVPAVFLRRTHPVAALLVFAPAVVLAGAFPLPASPFALPVLAYALQRRRRAVGVLVVGTLLCVAVTAAVRAALDGFDAVTAIGFGTGLAVSFGTQAAIGGALGGAARAAAERTARQRSAAEGARAAVAVAAERDRIAEEVTGGVLAGLRALADAAVGTDLLRRGAPASAVALQGDARRVLTALRRALTALRAPAEPEDPAAAPRRRALPLPTRSGVVLVAGFALLTALTDLVAPTLAAQPGTAATAALLDVALDRPLALPLLGVELLALAWWRSAPVGALVVLTLGSVGSWLAGTTHLVVETGWSVLVYAAASSAPPLVSAVTTALTAAAVVGLVLAAPQPAYATFGPGQTVGSLVLVPVLWAVGVARRAVRLRAERHAAAAAGGRLRDEVEAERRRVARDLHDVVAHHVSALAVQAGAARVTTDPQVLDGALDEIAELGRRIGAALPALAAATRHPDPVPLTADDLDRLVAPARAAGVPVDVRVSGTPAPSPGDAEVFAERIVTEALTNIVRHAGASPTTVTVDHHPAEVVVEVRDAGPVAGHRPGGAGSGLGLLGMRERAELLGGEVVVEVGAAGCTVHARLPRPADLLLGADPARSR
jgi:signal transduction histidine kinase